MLGVCAVSAVSSLSSWNREGARDGAAERPLPGCALPLEVFGILGVGREHLGAIQKGFAMKMTLLQQIHLQPQVNLEKRVSQG